MSIRQLSGTIRGGRLICSNFFRFSRNIYLHKGARVAGLKRDPETAFTTWQGYKYETSEENLKYIKGFLGDRYQLPDTLVLQILTHKSFGNGIKPYNEKLSAMGSKILNLWCAKLVTSQPTTNENAINGKNLDCLGSPIAKELAGRMALGLFARKTKLNTIMFWKSYNNDLSFEASGELKVLAQLVYALVGAVNFVHGKSVTERFIQEKLFEASPSVEDIAIKVVEHSASVD